MQLPNCRLPGWPNAVVTSDRTALRLAAATRILSCALVLTMAVAGCAAGGQTGGTTARTTTAAAPMTTESTTSGAASPESSADHVTPTPEAFDGTVVEVTIAGGQVQTADRRVIVTLNSRVRLIVTSDAADEVHIHGVDEYVDLVAGETATHDFVASIPGTFEVELHEAGDLLFSLQVQP